MLPSQIKLFKMLYTILIIYIVVGVGFYFFQDFIFFRSKRIDVNAPFKFDVPFKEVNIPYNSEYNFSIVQFFAKEPQKKLVLYFHGNHTNINRYAKHADNFTNRGYDVWMCDYPTFGKTTGKLTEAILYQEAEAFYELAKQQYADTNIVIYGKSFGSGLASYLASKTNTQQLILETPYNSFVDVAKQWGFMYPCHWMVKYKIPSYDYIAQTKIPVTIFHGTSDGTIYYSNACKLKAHLKPTDKFITIEGGEHNNIPSYEVYQKEIGTLLK